MKKQIIIILSIAALLPPTRAVCCPTCVAQANPEKYSAAFFKRDAYTRYENGVPVEKAPTIDEMLTKLRARAKKDAS